MKDQSENPSQPLREIFLQAAELQDPAARDRCLDEMCGTDQRLRKRVEALLAVEAVAGLPPEAQATVSEDGEGSAGSRIGPYKLREKIGEGGCGVVYVADQEEPVRRRVALKVIKLGMDTRSVVARFEAERQALAMMDHPNIARVFDAGATEKGRPYFVMELVRGIKITEYCDQNHLDTQRRLNLFIQVCHAVQHAHQKGIIHRDLKPSNILVTLHDAVPVPKVIDFGIAKATEGRLTDKTVYTELRQFLGTPAYMSPEQAEMSGLDIDTRSDIYSLGVLLYELLTGRTPFESQALLKRGLQEICRAIREVEPLRPSTRLNTLVVGDLTTVAKARASDPRTLVNLIRGDLDWVVMKALEKDRTRRYETANGLALDLRRHLNDEPVIARPPSLGYKFQKACRRHKLLLSAGAAVAAALVTGLGVSLWQAAVATKARDGAETARRQETEQRQAAQAARQQEESQRLRAEANEKYAQQLLYDANLNQAQQAWDLNHLRRLRELLAETAAHPERGFEWYYWQRQTHLESRALRGHTAPIFSLAFSPDGRRIVTGSWDTTAKVWDASSGMELLTLKGHWDEIFSVAFSPDGQRVMTASADQTAKIWDAVTGQELFTLQGHDGARHGEGHVMMAFSPDGQRIVTGSADGTAKLWNAANGQELLTFRNHAAAVFLVAFSPDGERIATGGADQTAKIWEAASGRELLTITGHSAAVVSVAFSPDGGRIVTGSFDGTARVWNAANGKELVTLQGRVSGPAIFSPDGQQILTGSLEQEPARVWDASTGRELFAIKGHVDWTVPAVFSPNGNWIATGGHDHIAKIWDASPDRDRLTLRGHSNAVTSAAFSPDGRYVLTGSWDNSAKLWETATGREVMTLRGHADHIHSVAFCPDGGRIVTAGFDAAIIWDVATGRDLARLRSVEPWPDYSSAAFSPDGRRIVTSARGQRIRVWDAASGAELQLIKEATDIRSAAFSPDGKRIVSGSDAGMAQLWDASNGQELLALKGHDGAIVSVAFAPDGQRIATASHDQTVKVWRLTGQELFTLKGHHREVTSVAFAPDGQRMVSGSFDATVRVWDSSTGKELLVLRGATNGISAVAISPDGRRIVAGSFDQTARIWEAASDPQVLDWQREEKAAAERLERSQREQAAAEELARQRRARDPGAIKQWLVLGPFGIDGGDGAAALEQKQIPREANLRPRAGEQATVGERELVWRAVEQEDFVLDFNELLGGELNFAVAYAVSYIQSAADQRGLVMQVGCDDQALVYLNGREVFRQPRARRKFHQDQNIIPGVELKAGLNTVVLKVVNERSDWKSSIRLTTASDQPVAGITAALAP